MKRPRVFSDELLSLCKYKNNCVILKKITVNCHYLVQFMIWIDFSSVIMGEPVLKRINTIGIRFIKGEKTDDLLEKIIEDKLGIHLDEICGLADYGPKRHLVKVKTTQKYGYLVDRFLGFPIRVDRNTDIEIDDISSYKSRVKIQRFAFEMSMETLTELLARYGEVDKVIRGKKRGGKYNGTPTDEAIAWMTISTPIPSSLWIREIQNNMFFSYEKQPQTCHKCGSADHKVNQCDCGINSNPDNRANAVNLQMYEENVDANDSAMHAHETDMDRSIPLTEDANVSNDTIESTSRSTFSTESDADSDAEVMDVETFCHCPEAECDFKCKTMHEMNDHTKNIHDTYAAKAAKAKSPDKRKVVKKSEASNKGIGVSASQPSTSTHPNSDNTYRKRGASASPISENTRQKKIHKVNRKNRNKLMWVNL